MSDYETYIDSIAQTSYGFSVVSLILRIVMIAGLWMVFKKAGEAGWKSLIPLYNDYLRCKIAKRTDLFWKVILCVIGMIIGLVIGNTGIESLETDGSSAMAIVGFIMILGFAIATVVLSWKIAKGLATSFGQGTAFAVGLFLLSEIFTAIVGFGHYEYVGNQEDSVKAEPKPIEDGEKK